MWRWMEEMEVFLQADEAALGDLDTLHAQLAESNVSCDIGVTTRGTGGLSYQGWGVGDGHQNASLVPRLL